MTENISMYPQPNGPNALAPLCHTKEPRDIHQMNGRGCSQLQESPLLPRQVGILTAEPQPAVQTLPTSCLAQSRAPLYSDFARSFTFSQLSSPSQEQLFYTFTVRAAFSKDGVTEPWKWGRFPPEHQGRPSFEFNNRFPENRNHYKHY